MSIVQGLLVLALACLANAAIISRSSDAVTDGTELVFAFMTHRHGDRTPVTTTMSYINLNAEAQAEAVSLIEAYGYGQLTDEGRRTGYKTGQFIRRRYDELIAAKYNKSEMFIRSTDSTRTKMTVLTALSAIYPPTADSWSKKINWVPVPYTTIPAKYDFNEAFINCPNYMTDLYSAMLLQNDRMEPFADVIARASEIIGIDFSSMPTAISSIYDVYVSLDSLGFDIGDEARAIMPELEAAAGVVWDITYGENVNMSAGPFLNEFFTYADEIIAGADTQKVRIYSAHDANVYALQVISRLTPRQGAPKYGSLLSLELRQVTATGEYFVLPVYLKDPKVGTESYLQVDGCGDSYLCAYESFRTLTADDVMDEDEWRTICGFTDDLAVDTGGID